MLCILSKPLRWSACGNKDNSYQRFFVRKITLFDHLCAWTAREYQSVFAAPIDSWRRRMENMFCMFFEKQCIYSQCICICPPINDANNTWRGILVTTKMSDFTLRQNSSRSRVFTRSSWPVVVLTADVNRMDSPDCQRTLNICKKCSIYWIWCL